jgi:hypothetical protein
MPVVDKVLTSYEDIYPPEQIAKAHNIAVDLVEDLIRKNSPLRI